MQKGMTLIELLVTLVVVSVLLAVAVPSYDNVRNSQKLINNTSAIFDFVEQTMQKAKRSNKQITYYLSGSADSWCIGASDASSSTSCNCISNKSQCVINGTTALLNDITVPVTFNGLDGGKYFIYSGVRSTIKAGNITIANKYGSTKLMFSNYGRVTVCAVDGKFGYERCSDASKNKAR